MLGSAARRSRWRPSLHHSGVGANLIGAQQLGRGRLGQQRLVEPGDRVVPAPGGDLHQRRRMRHPGTQRDPAKPLPGDRIGHFPTQRLIAQPVPELQKHQPQVAPGKRPASPRRNTCLRMSCVPSRCRAREKWQRGWGPTATGMSVRMSKTAGLIQADRSHSTTSMPAGRLSAPARRIDRTSPAAGSDDVLQLVIEGDNNDTGSPLLFVATRRVQRLLCRGEFSRQRRTAAPGVRRHHGRGRDQEK
jgi:hypothetical protein